MSSECIVCGEHVVDCKCGGPEVQIIDGNEQWIKLTIHTFDDDNRADLRIQVNTDGPRPFFLSEDLAGELLDILEKKVKRIRGYNAYCEKERKEKENAGRCCP